MPIMLMHSSITVFACPTPTTMKDRHRMSRSPMLLETVCLQRKILPCVLSSQNGDPSVGEGKRKMAMKKARLLRKPNISDPQVQSSTRPSISNTRLNPPIQRRGVHSRSKQTPGQPLRWLLRPRHPARAERRQQLSCLPRMLSSRCDGKPMNRKAHL